MVHPRNLARGATCARKQIDIRLLAPQTGVLELKCTKGGKASVLNCLARPGHRGRVAARFELGGPRVDGVRLPYPEKHDYQDYRFEALGATWTSEDGRQPVVYALKGGRVHLVQARVAVFVFT